ncbi:PolC-type DNA polymerase III [Streptococcus ruminantium]|uniref:PolC-type DNA polymerase III n=1 Tax=Streptococcus ruminantium TaxID=1917441 RepID=A0A2Z5TP48_9STRE|nr:PolC-type DNA polymerase III [Streptococcus ruminantium]
MHTKKTSIHFLEDKTKPAQFPLETRQVLIYFQNSSLFPATSLIAPVG